MTAFTRTIEDPLSCTNTVTSAATTSGVAPQKFPRPLSKRINPLLAEGQWLYVNATSNQVGRTPLAPRKDTPKQ